MIPPPSIGRDTGGGIEKRKPFPFGKRFARLTSSGRISRKPFVSKDLQAVLVLGWGMLVTLQRLIRYSRGVWLVVGGGMPWCSDGVGILG